MSRRTIVFLLGFGLSAGLAWGATGIDEGEICLACHDDLAEAISTPILHPPAAEGQCSACHNPHVSQFDGLLRDRPGPLCGACHDSIAAELDRSVVHEPVADGRCVDCHTPHGGRHDGLLVRGGVELCVECHQEVDTWSAKAVQHPPFAVGDCASCHEPHASDHDGLATADGTQVCQGCHEVDLAFRSAHQSYPVETAPCQQCHDPHASDSAGLFRSSAHAPFAEGNCTDCHALPGSAEPFRTRLPEHQLCGECHSEQVDESIAAPYGHVSAGGGDCVACHNPHTADGSGLLKRETNALCLECHDPGGSSSGDPGRYVSHGTEEDPLACTVCHGPHGSDQFPMFQAPVNELCSSCHSHQHSVAHPMGEGTADPRTGQPVDCLGCHGLHNAPYPKYMHRSSERELCVGCHKELGGSR